MTGFYMTTSTRIELWPFGAPGALSEEEIDKPHLDFYAPQKPNGGAVIVCPGGGYGFLALDHEGAQIAQWLNDRGFAAFVLHYRIAPRYKHPIPLLDAQRALRVVRNRAEEWNIESDKIGIWGFSAGGHLAACCATLFDEGQRRASDLIDTVSCRPSFCVLAYPVVSMRESWMHEGSRDNLIGANASEELALKMSPEANVSPETPPTFLFHTADDDVVPSQNSVAFYLALREQNVPAELHIYERGAHGVGLALDDATLASWTRRLHFWLRRKMASDSSGTR